MTYFNGKFNKREKKFRRNYEIEDNLYNQLQALSKVYDASVNDLINASLEYLIYTENIALYKKDINEITVAHTQLIRESNLIGLDKLKEKYSVSIYKLVNIAIRNAIIDDKLK